VKNYRLITVLAGHLFALGFTNSALGADSDEQRELDRRSAEVGLGRDSVELLVRKRGPGVAAVKARMLRAFGTDRY
jgi:hypothetical protein